MARHSAQTMHQRTVARSSGPSSTGGPVQGKAASQAKKAASQAKIESSKASPGRRRSEASHQAILQAAASLLQETGYVGMSVEAIARRAGVGKQTIYRWWPSKADVVLELYQGVVDRSLSAPDTGTVQGDLTAWLEQWIALLQTGASAQALAGILVEAQSNPAIAQHLQEQILSGRRGTICLLLQRGIQRGELRDDLNIELAADLIFSPIWYRLLLEGSRGLAEPFATQLVDGILLGLQAFEEDL